MRARGLALWACLAVAGGAAASPETDYALQCRGCHGPDGAGVEGHVPPLSGMVDLLATPAGRARLLAVPGIRQASLDDARLAALLTWAAARFAPPDHPLDAAPLLPEEVGRGRSSSAARARRPQ